MKGDVKGNGSLTHGVAQLAALASALTSLGQRARPLAIEKGNPNEPKRINRHA